MQKKKKGKMYAQIRVNVNLHSIRFSSVFLRFCFFMKKNALFHPQFCKSISTLSRLLYIGKDFVQKFCV